MANGLLGKGVTNAGQWSKIYTVPSNAQFATISFTAVNMNANMAKVRVAISLSDTVSAADHVEFDSELPANGGVLERTCIVVSPGERIHFFADNADVAVRVFGLEQL